MSNGSLKYGLSFGIALTVIISCSATDDTERIGHTPASCESTCDAVCEKNRTCDVGDCTVRCNAKNCILGDTTFMCSNKYHDGGVYYWLASAVCTTDYLSAQKKFDGLSLEVVCLEVR